MSGFTIYDASTEPAPKAYPPPSPSSDRPMHQLYTGMWMEHRDGESLIWEEDWWDGERPVPMAVLDGERTVDDGNLWAGAWLAGRAEGLRQGLREGFADCQAGLRALLGAASAADVNRLVRAAEIAADGRDD